MAQHDMNIANQSFPSFRTDLNNALSAINSMQSGTSRPSGAVAGTMWLDTTNATNPTLKLYDGSDDISLAIFDYSANTVNWLDSTVSADLVNDLSPQLGGMLDVNGNAIGNGTEELIKFSETASAVNEVTVTNSATGNAPEISATGSDTNIDFKLTPKGTGKLILDGLNFPTSDGTADQVLKTDGSGNLSFTDVSGGTNTPAFHAYLSSAQSIPSTTQTLIQFDTEAFDSDGAYDTSTYKFTPQVAGKYVVYAQMSPSSAADYDTFELQMYKNAVTTAGTQAIFRGRNEAHDTKYINRIVEFNGSTDFVYMYTYQDSGAGRNIRGTKYDTFFGAYKIIE